MSPVDSEVLLPTIPFRPQHHGIAFNIPTRTHDRVEFQMCSPCLRCREPIYAKLEDLLYMPRELCDKLGSPDFKPQTHNRALSCQSCGMIGILDPTANRDIDSLIVKLASKHRMPQPEADTRKKVAPRTLKKILNPATWFSKKIHRSPQESTENKSVSELTGLKTTLLLAESMTRLRIRELAEALEKGEHASSSFDPAPTTSDHTQCETVKQMLNKALVHYKRELADIIKAWETVSVQELHINALATRTRFFSAAESTGVNYLDTDLDLMRSFSQGARHATNEAMFVCRQVARAISERQKQTLSSLQLPVDEIAGCVAAAIAKDNAEIDAQLAERLQATAPVDTAPTSDTTRELVTN